MKNKYSKKTNQLATLLDTTVKKEFYTIFKTCFVSITVQQLPSKQSKRH